VARADFEDKRTKKSQEAKGRKIAIIGGPGSGKTLLAKALVIHMRLKGYDAVPCDEYIRDYIRDSGMLQHYGEQFPILYGSSAREDGFQEVHQFVVCDGASFFAETYMAYYRPEAMSESEEKKWEFAYDIVRRLARARLKTFDQLFFVSRGNFTLSADPQRYNPDDAEQMGRALKGYLDYQRIPYTEILATELDARVAEISKYLAELKWIDLSRSTAEFHAATEQIHEINRAATAPASQTEESVIAEELDGVDGIPKRK
jgi:nicotinamide riboside kinase